MRRTPAGHSYIMIMMTSYGGIIRIRFEGRSSCFLSARFPQAPLYYLRRPSENRWKPLTAIILRGQGLSKNIPEQMDAARKMRKLNN